MSIGYGDSATPAAPCERVLWTLRKNNLDASAVARALSQRAVELRISTAGDVRLCCVFRDQEIPDLDAVALEYRGVFQEMGWHASD
jgi:hypothetical protein